MAAPLDYLKDVKRSAAQLTVVYPLDYLKDVKRLQLTVVMYRHKKNL